jgi:hypothetical protein
MKEGHTMTDEELIDALGTDLGLSWDMVFCEDKGAAVRDAASIITVKIILIISDLHQKSPKK